MSSSITDEWTVGHPSENKSFIATIVIASLLIVAFFVGCGFMVYYWVRSWRGKDIDNYKPNSTSGDTNEKTENVDLEAQRQRPGTPPPERTIYESDDESPIVQGGSAVSKWRQETVSVGGSESSRSQSQSQASSARSSSDLSSVEGHVPERPRSRDLHELYPSN